MGTATADARVGELDAIIALMRDRRSVVLAGAGCSTESGIPDYRGPDGRNKVRKPVQYGDFVRSEAARRRYWARSTVGWRRVSRAKPNAAHAALAQLESRGVVGGIITQNVDGLHHAAGNRTIVELHGSLEYVVCLTCGDRSRRDALQERLMAANEGWVEDAIVGEGQPVESAPDGDAELADAPYADFRVLACVHCDGVLKPDVVFFGENVPRDRVTAAWQLVDEADVLVVVGSSLTVYSGRRFVYGAVERGMPIGVVNLGPTRADDVAYARVEGRLGEVMPRIAQALAQ
jgi:NAD-dependent SIR2 family protein deacetylase